MTKPISGSPIPPIDKTNLHPLTNKLWLTSKLSPPPPPPPPPITKIHVKNEKPIKQNEAQKNSELPKNEFLQEGKIFVGNLPNWVKKNEVFELFRQFRPIKDVILVKGHESTERNAGFEFVLYGGSTSTKSAMKAVEFDGMKFHGRVLTVKLDDGRRLKDKTEERTLWIEGYDNADYRSKWHKELDKAFSA